MAKHDFMSQLQSSPQFCDTEEDFDTILTAPTPVSSPDGDIRELLISELVEYSDSAFASLSGRSQPFKPYSPDRLTSLAKSIKENGVMNPIIVRPLPDGKYQILAGHNRTRACALCGKSTVPAVIREGLSDIESAMIMLDTNLEQRPSLTYSEKAYAYKMRIELQKKRGKRTDLDGSEKTDTLTAVGKDQKDSRRMVAYLVRLTYLTPEWLSKVDDGSVNFKVGVALSYLSTKTQDMLLSMLKGEGAIKIKAVQIKKLQSFDETGTVDETIIRRIFFTSPTPPPPTFTVSGERLREFADILTDQSLVENLFFEFLRNYRSTLCNGCTK